MNDDRNSTEYICATVLRGVSKPTVADLKNESDHTILYVTGKYTADHESYVCIKLMDIVNCFT